MMEGVMPADMFGIPSDVSPFGAGDYPKHDPSTGQRVMMRVLFCPRFGNGLIATIFGMSSHDCKALGDLRKRNGRRFDEPSLTLMLGTPKRYGRQFTDRAYRDLPEHASGSSTWMGGTR